MGTRLRSFSQALRSASALKTVVFGALLAVAGIGEFRLLPAFLFAAAALGLYLFPLFRTLRLLPSFAVLLAASLLIPGRFAGSGLFIPLAVLAAALYYLLLRLKDLAFVFRERWHHLFVLGAGYLAFLGASPSLASQFATLRLLAVALAVFVLLTQFFDEQRIRFTHGTRQGNAVALSIALVVAEMLWVGSVLPVARQNAASIGLIALYVATDFALRASRETLNRQTIIRQSLLAGILLILIFVTTRWAI